MPYVQRRSRQPTQLTARQLAHLTTIPKLPSSPLTQTQTHPHFVTSHSSRRQGYDAPSSRKLVIEEVNGITNVLVDQRGEGTVKGKRGQDEEDEEEGDRVDENEHVQSESNKVMPIDGEGRGRSDSIVKDITNSDSTSSLRRPGSKRSESQISFEMILPDSQFNQKVNDFYAENGLSRNNGGEFYPEHEEWTFLNYEEEEVLTETGGSITERLFCVTTRA